jgi:hypothetical protein
LALATPKFLIGELLGVRFQDTRINEEARPAVGEPILPEIQTILVVGTALQIGDSRSIR